MDLTIPSQSWADLSVDDWVDGIKCDGYDRRGSGQDLLPRYRGVGIVFSVGLNGGFRCGLSPFS